MNLPYREFAPSPRLRAHIECFWCHESSAAIPDFRVLPDGCVDILFQRRGNGNSTLSVVGTMTRAHYFELPQRQFALGVRFKPAMAARFLRIGAAEIVDRTIALDDVWNSRRTRHLTELIAEAKTPEEGAAHFETALGEATPLDLPGRAIAQVVGSRGQAKLDELAQTARLSPRQFRRVCRERTGVSPKRLARILRFRNAVTLATLKRQGDWADVALECGYYDQAHLINEFREFSGVAPGSFSSELVPQMATRPE